MLCPQCDGVLNIRGCLSCGWSYSDSWPAHRLAPDSVQPLKPGAEYPKRSGSPVILKNFGKLALVPPVLKVPPEPAAEPIAGPVGYVVGALKDEDGNVTDHILVGPIPFPEGGGPKSTEQQATLQTAPSGLPSAAPAAPEKPIPDPITRTVQ